MSASWSNLADMLAMMRGWTLLILEVRWEKVDVTMYISTVACRKVPSAVLGQNDILMFFGPDSPFLAPHKITELNSKYFICYTWIHKVPFDNSTHFDCIKVTFAYFDCMKVPFAKWNLYALKKYVCFRMVLLHKGAIWQMEPLCTHRIDMLDTLIHVYLEH